jgi:hypothetical protein
VLSSKAKSALESLLSGAGEFLPLADDFWIFNCFDSIDGDSIDAEVSKFQIDVEDSLHISTSLTLKSEKISGKVLFKPGFAHNSFLMCSDEFRDIAIKENLGGVVFEENLAKIFL